jgi:proton-translocating NADH-quinone oxidoreductase chain M
MSLHFLLTVILGTIFDFSQNDFSIELSYRWIDILGINASFSIDSLSMLLIILTSFIFLIVVYLSKHIIKKSHNLYYSIIFMLLTSIIGLFCTKDLFVFLFFLSLTFLPSYLLIKKWGLGNRDKTSMNFLMYSFVSYIVILLGFLLLYYVNFKATGTLSSDVNDIDITNLPSIIKNLIFILLFVGFGMYLPVIPVHKILVNTQTNVPSPISIIFSSILFKVGAYGILRLNLQFFNEEFAKNSEFLIVFAVINIIYATICAINQKDIKRIISYFTISSMGIFLLGLASFNEIGITGAIFQIFSHSIISCGLFMLTGFIYMQNGTTNLLRINNLSGKMPKLMFISIPIVLSAINIPILCGFPAMFLTFLGAFNSQSESMCIKLIILISLCVLIFSSIYTLKIYHSLFFAPKNDLKQRKIIDLNVHQLVLISIILINIVVLGCFPNILTDVITQYITNLNGVL